MPRGQRGGGARAASQHGERGDARRGRAAAARRGARQGPLGDRASHRRTPCDAPVRRCARPARATTAARCRFDALIHSAAAERRSLLSDARWSLWRRDARLPGVCSAALIRQLYVLLRYIPQLSLSSCASFNSACFELCSM